MVYHSVPDPNKTYPHYMTNFELIRTEISKIYFDSNNTLINLVEATQTIIYPKEVDLSRVEVIELMKKQGSNFYFKNRILILEVINNTPFIHFEKSVQPKDILE